MTNKCKHRKKNANLNSRCNQMLRETRNTLIFQSLRYNSGISEKYSDLNFSSRWRTVALCLIQIKCSLASTQQVAGGRWFVSSKPLNPGGTPEIIRGIRSGDDPELPFHTCNKQPEIRRIRLFSHPEGTLGTSGEGWRLGRASRSRTVSRKNS